MRPRPLRMESGPWRKDREAHGRTTMTTPPRTTERKRKGRQVGRRPWVLAKAGWPTRAERSPDGKWTINGAPRSRLWGCLCCIRSCSFQYCMVDSSRIMAGFPAFRTFLAPKLLHDRGCLSNLSLSAAVQCPRQSKGCNTAAGWTDGQTMTLCKSFSQDSPLL